MKEKLNENKKKNEKYKFTILKIYSELPDHVFATKEIKTVKIVSYDIMNSIDNLEYLEGTYLNRHLPKDKLFFKYEKEIEIEDYEKFIKRSDYKKVIKYLKNNNINEETIDKNRSIIYGYLKRNNNNTSNINLETLKKAILKSEEIKYNNIEQRTIHSSPKGSGETVGHIIDGGNLLYTYLNCIIKMTEYTPISGGNITELNKIPELFLNKRRLLVLKSNDDKCFYIVILGNF